MPRRTSSSQPGAGRRRVPVEGKLGEGGFGTVYRAVHPLIGKQAAIKVLHRQYSANPQMVSRFIAEARAVNQIRHRNIIDIFSFGQLPDGRQYYVMELLEGAPLDEYLQARGTARRSRRRMPILRGVARALDAAHAKGIVHRDLKPENIFLVRGRGRHAVPEAPRLRHRQAARRAMGSSHKTQTGAPMGTPYYMSPEQCRGRDVDHRTDIYSFGVMTYEVLTGELPVRRRRTSWTSSSSRCRRLRRRRRGVQPQLPAGGRRRRAVDDGEGRGQAAADAGRGHPRPRGSGRLGGGERADGSAHGVPSGQGGPGTTSPMPAAKPSVTPAALPAVTDAAGLATARTMAAADPGESLLHRRRSDGPAGSRGDAVASSPPSGQFCCSGRRRLFRIRRRDDPPRERDARAAPLRPPPWSRPPAAAPTPAPTRRSRWRRLRPSPTLAPPAPRRRLPPTRSPPTAAPTAPATAAAQDPKDKRPPRGHKKPKKPGKDDIENPF